MSLDPTLSKDPVQAAAILAEDALKNENECRYPTCHDMRQVTMGTGRPSAYCSNTQHTAVNSHRARQQLRTTAATMTASNATSKREALTTPVTPPVESLRNSVVSRITLLQTDLERYVVLLAEMSDPDVSAAQIRAALDQANARIAEAQQRESTEQALRLAAETTLLAAQEEVRSEREAAEQAIVQMEEAKANAQHQIEVAEQHSKQIQIERDAMVEQVRIETQQRIKEIEQQVSSTIAQARSETVVAQEEARQANTAALEARAQASTAERLVSEAHTSLERERSEIDRLRKELAETIAEARRRAEADRVEAQTALRRERSEIDRLREELTTIRKQSEQATSRADALALSNDQLRVQLAQSQTRHHDQK